ncbi:hypothetical protein WQ54_27660 [Bacillus sp. SA1-12]|nr:hypothetical protein WQ54_27660 [Bacillus sp. SA1-12]
MELVIFTFGIILFTSLDYLIFDQEKKRWGWFKKKTKGQRIMICCLVLVILSAFNFFSFIT